MGRKTQAAKAERIRIEYISIDEVAKWPRNPKLHADAELDESFERFGFVAPAIRDDKTQRLVAGHGRLERLITWRDQGKPAPKRIDVATDGKWLMPVVCGVSFDNAQEAEAYLLADNQITMSRGWDGPTLQAIGDDLIGGAGLLGTGFDEESIRAEMEERVAGAGIGNGESETGDGAGTSAMCRVSRPGRIKGQVAPATRTTLSVRSPPKSGAHQNKNMLANPDDSLYKPSRTRKQEYSEDGLRDLHTHGAGCHQQKP